MKRCIKYCLILIFALLLHNNSASGSVEAERMPVLEQEASCTLSQAPSTWQVTRKFHDLCSSNAPCIEHVDHTQVPNDKGVVLRLLSYKMQPCANASECDGLLHLAPHPVPDANYYVFGLRKIII